MKKFPVCIQHDAMDCGATCIKMITDFNLQSYSLSEIKEICMPTREGISLSNIAQTLDELGYNTIGGKLTVERLCTKAPLPCILHWNQEHFVVLHKISKKKNETVFHIADPGVGLVKYSQKEFVENWCTAKSGGEEKGVVLLLEKKANFQRGEKKSAKSNVKTLLPYIMKYKQYFALLFLGLLVGSVIQLVFPFLTKSIVDVGIENDNVRFITIILFAQLILLLSKMGAEFVQNWLLLHISTRINVSMLSDFLIKMMKLPMRFFDTKLTGDILQRFEDHRRLEHFVTTQSLSIVYAVINFIVFGGILLYFNIKIFLVFLIGSALYIIWLLTFMKKRRILDYEMFEQRARNDSKTYQLIEGMQEIKLQGCSQRMRWEWEDIQAKLFEVNVKLLKLSQSQKTGSIFINETKNVLITFLVAYAVIEGSLTLGVMIAIQFIIGQLNMPIEHIAQFIYSLQDTKISMERIADIKEQDDEDIYRPVKSMRYNKKNISIENLSFAYAGTKNEVLKNINLEVDEGKKIAIVGASGSGKTTLMKLLLQYYPITSGAIRIGGFSSNKVDTKYWRSLCGAVMQDGFIFSDTIAKNIAISDDIIDLEQLTYAAELANLNEFVEQCPLKYDTIIGQEGRGLSQGQKQRILIARAIYKNPQFLFLDEATNALDTSNEKEITDKLQDFMKEKTVFIVAHRLSTVKDADHIIVLNNGCIVEQGTHKTLVDRNGYYYELIKNQLELGN